VTKVCTGLLQGKCKAVSRKVMTSLSHKSTYKTLMGILHLGLRDFEISLTITQVPLQTPNTNPDGDLACVAAGLRKRLRRTLDFEVRGQRFPDLLHKHEQHVCAPEGRRVKLVALRANVSRHDFNASAGCASTGGSVLAPDLAPATI
jgi:hypothetical protein